MNPDDALSFGWRGTYQGAQLKEGGSSGFDARFRDIKMAQFCGMADTSISDTWVDSGVLRNMIQSSLLFTLFMSRMIMFIKGHMIRLQLCQSDV